MKRLLKYIILPIFIALFTFGLFTPKTYVNTIVVNAEESTKEINHITSIDVSFLPSTVTSGHEETATIKITYEKPYSKEYNNETLNWYMDGASSSGKAYASIIKYDEAGDATVSITGSTDGTCTLIFYGAHSDRTTAEVRTTYSVVVKPYETVASIIGGILSTNSILILIISIAAAVIARTSIKIFRFGVNYKSEFATKTDQKEFEKSIRDDMRASKVEIQDNVLKLCLREIQRETRPLKDLQTLTTNFERNNEILNIKLDTVDQKYNEIRKVSENIASLQQQINRIQYGEANSDVRRSGK